MGRLTDLELFERHVEALYTHDRDGRIRTNNEPDGAMAPRFALGLTKMGNLWRCRDDLAPEVARRLGVVASTEPIHDDLREMPEILPDVREILGDDPESAPAYVGPVYCFPNDMAPVGEVTRLTRANLGLLRDMPSYYRDIAATFAVREPVHVVVEDGVAVSLCYSSRLTDGAAEAGVETLSAYRGRGYATAVVAAWSAGVLAGGRIPFYGTTWDNQGSQGVARRLGLVLIGADCSL